VSYQNYVIAAYAVFFLVLGWDFVSTRIQIARQLRGARQRKARDAARVRAPRSLETP
jgi:heme exporter protein D